MSRDRWQRLQQLFDAASAVPAAGREAFLAEACADDDDLRGLAASLLSHRYDPDGWTTTPTDGSVDPENEKTLLGQRVCGRYLVQREIARGGMANVYLAVQDDEPRQSVAVKVLAHVSSRDVLRRFRAEGRILGRLSHPGIARLLDGGTAEDGRPCLVMEYVDGTPITDYCRERGLPAEERVSLFRAVCAAVHHAHQSLVVHRDIKPSNLLVDVAGAPKLLDFGIAKLLAGDDSGADPFDTAAHVRLMTPAYASPEQARGEAITTASDVYSLGVLLREILTEERPVESATRPDARSTLDPDLETIVAKAMHPDPARRYASAEQLSEDLGRYLGGMPLVARPDSFGYRASRFVRRNRGAVAACVVCLAAIVAFGAWMAVTAARLREERDQARAAAAHARAALANVVRIQGERAAAGAPPAAAPAKPAER